MARLGERKLSADSVSITNGKEQQVAYDMGMDVGDTLAQVNIVREAFGMNQLYELPNASMGQPAACLFYRALADCGAKSVSGQAVKFASERQAALVADLWGTRSHGIEVVAPTQMKRTIGNFDGAAFPHYAMPHESNENWDGPTYEDEPDDDDDEG